MSSKYDDDKTIIFFESTFLFLKNTLYIVV